MNITEAAKDPNTWARLNQLRQQYLQDSADPEKASAAKGQVLNEFANMGIDGVGIGGNPFNGLPDNAPTSNPVQITPQPNSMNTEQPAPPPQETPAPTQAPPPPQETPAPTPEPTPEPTLLPQETPAPTPEPTPAPQPQLPAPIPQSASPVPVITPAPAPTYDPNAMVRAMQAEMQQQFQGSRDTLSHQLQAQAELQRQAFEQEMMPNLTGQAVEMGHYGSTREGIAEGLARGKMESQLAVQQAGAVANLESNIASMQNQWGLGQMNAANQLTLQNFSGQQAMAQIGARSQADMEVARQKGLVDMGIAQLQNSLSMDQNQQKHLLDLDSASQQQQFQKSLSSQQADQAMALEQYRQEQDLKNQQALISQGQSNQLQLKSVDADQAMAMAQFQSQHSYDQAMALAQLHGQQTQDQTKLQGQMDMQKTQMTEAFNVLGNAAKSGLLTGYQDQDKQTGAAVRQILGLPVITASPTTQTNGLLPPSQTSGQNASGTPTPTIGLFGTMTVPQANLASQTQQKPNQIIRTPGPFMPYTW